MAISSTSFISIQNNFRSLQNDIKALQEAPSSEQTVDRLQQLTRELKEKVSLATDYARGAGDPHTKYAVCLEIIGLNNFLQQEKQPGVFTHLLKEHAAVSQQLQASIADMVSTVNNVLVRGNDRQDVFGTRFNSDQCLSDEQWEQYMRGTHHLPVESVGVFKYYVLFAASLIWTQLLSLITPRNWWNKITTTDPHQPPLYLGALPLITPLRNDLNTLKKEGIGAVLSVLEPFENKSPGWISSPVTPAKWKEAGIKQLQISMEDFGTGPLTDVEHGVEFIRWNVINNRSVYIHCKAGRGRSALILLAYLIKYEDLSIDEAIKRMKLARPHAGFPESSTKMQTLRAYEKRVRLPRV